jgi:hypothetical protein
MTDLMDEIEGVIATLEHGVVDRASIKTLKGVAERIRETPAIWLKTIGERIIVSLLIADKEVEIINEPRGGEISHIAEPGLIDELASQGRGTQARARVALIKRIRELEAMLREIIEAEAALLPDLIDRADKLLTNDMGCTSRMDQLTPKQRHDAALKKAWTAYDNSSHRHDIDAAILAYLRVLAEPDKNGNAYVMVPLVKWQNLGQKPVALFEWLKEIEQFE